MHRADSTDKLPPINVCANRVRPATLIHQVIDSDSPTAQLCIAGMAVDGEPHVVCDFGACLTWDGRKLPGPWLVSRALDEAMVRASRFGMGAVAIQRSHHAASHTEPLLNIAHLLK